MLCVHNLAISLDRYAAGPGQSLDSPSAYTVAVFTSGCLQPAGRAFAGSSSVEHHRWMCT